MLFTQRLVNDADSLPTGHNPYPGSWQPYLEKSREWRITIVGDRSFDVAIHTAGDARTDWRRYQGTPLVEYKRATFPEEEKERCFAFLKRQGLPFGILEFVEDNDGKLTFLESNPNGQYGWLEDALDLPISQAVADALAKIAQNG